MIMFLRLCFFTAIGLCCLLSHACAQQVNPKLDGKIVFVSQRGTSSHFYSINPDGSDEGRLIPKPEGGERSAFSGDGNTIVYVKGERVNEETQFHLWKMNADGSNPVQLTHRGTWNDYPTLDTHGRKVLFNGNETKRFQVYSMDTNGSDLKQLTNRPLDGQRPAVSYDGEDVIYYTSPGLFSLSGKSQVPLQLTDTRKKTGGYDAEPAFSPDSRQIVFVSTRDGANDIYRMNRDGSQPVRLTDLQGVCSSPRFSPDGSRIVFASNHDGNWQIWTMNADGTDLKRVTDGKFDCKAPFWIGLPATPPVGTTQAATGKEPGGSVLQNDQTPPTLEVLSPAVGAVLKLGEGILPELTGVARDNASGIVSVSAILVRYANAGASIPAAYWDWNRKAWSPDATLLNEGKAVGSDSWRIFLPALPSGFYGSRVTVRDGAGNATRSDWLRFTVQAQDGALPTTRSEVLFLSANARSDRASIELRFTGPLLSSSAVRPENYLVMIDGDAATIRSTFYERQDQMVELRLDAGKLRPGISVVVEWKNLRDESDQSMSGKTTITAR